MISRRLGKFKKQYTYNKPNLENTGHFQKNNEANDLPRALRNEF